MCVVWHCSLGSGWVADNNGRNWEGPLQLTVSQLCLISQYGDDHRYFDDDNDFDFVQDIKRL